jgi:hypothetical protein
MSVNSQFQSADNIIVQIIELVFKRHCIPASWHSLRNLLVNATLKKKTVSLLLASFKRAI